MIQGFKNACRAGLQAQAELRRRYSSKAATSIKEEWRKRRNVIWDNEFGRQTSQVGNIEKITVTYHPPSEEDNVVQMSMNKELSTPSDCAKHLSQFVYETGALATVDGVPYDMNRPLLRDCDLKIFTMMMPEQLPILNTSFWRTCSFILGAMVESAFKDDIQLYLHSFPWPNIKSGSFVYDVVLDLPNWRPTDAELRAMSAQFVKITSDCKPIERLEVPESLALDMFQDNPFKSKQIPDIAKSNEGRVTLYRVGDHIDVSKGPMVGHTGIVGKATVTAVHKLESDDTDHMYRFQGLALPRGAYLNHFAYGILENRARKLNNTMWMPKAHEEAEERMDSFVANN